MKQLIKKSPERVPEYIRPITIAFLMKLLIEDKPIVIKFVDDKDNELFYASEFLEYFEEELKRHSLGDFVSCRSNSSTRNIPLTSENGYDSEVHFSIERGKKSQLELALKDYIKCYKEGKINTSNMQLKSFNILFEEFISELQSKKEFKYVSIDRLEYLPVILYYAFEYNGIIKDYKLDYEYIDTGYNYLNVYNDESIGFVDIGFSFEDNWVFQAIIDVQNVNNYQDAIVLAKEELKPQSLKLFRALLDNIHERTQFTLPQIEEFLGFDSKRVNKNRVDKAVSRMNSKLKELFNTDEVVLKYNRRSEYYEFNDIWGT